MALAIIGRKLGMTRLYDGSGRVRAVTVIEAAPNPVTQLRTIERDGYEAVQIAARGTRKRVTRPLRGHLLKADVAEPLAELQEFRVQDLGEYTLGQHITVEQFEPGQFVDVSGVSRGRGFAGVVRRWGFAGGPKTHGQSDRHRAPGSIGAGTTPGKVWKGQKMGGHMGARHKTVLNLLVVQVDAARNLIFVEGSVPGARSALVTVRPARRESLPDFQPPAPLAPPEEIVAPPPVEIAAEQTSEEAAAEDATAEETGEEETATEATGDEQASDEATREVADAASDDAPAEPSDAAGDAGDAGAAPEDTDEANDEAGEAAERTE